MSRYLFPGAPVPGDLGWNSGSCVSWHSMARLQPCSEVVSYTALSALGSAYPSARSKSSLRLCRPHLVVVRCEKRNWPPAESGAQVSCNFLGAKATIQQDRSPDEAGSPTPGLPAWNTHTPSMPHHRSSLITTNPRKATQCLREPTIPLPVEQYQGNYRLRGSG